MFASLTTEVILSLATVGVSSLAVCGTLAALRTTQRKPGTVDMETIVATAPYHRLHNVLTPKDF